MILTSHGVLSLVAMACLPAAGLGWRAAIALSFPLLTALYGLVLLNPSFRLRLPATAVPVPAILLGGVAAALATVSVPAAVENIHENWIEAGRQLRQKEEVRQQRVNLERTTLQRLRMLRRDASLQELFVFLAAGSDLARGEVLERIAALPQLSFRLSQLLARGETPWAGFAASYVADYYYGASDQGLCDSMGAHLGMLRGQLDQRLRTPWNQVRDYQRSAVKAFEASRKLTRLGCNLEWEREQWLLKLENAPQGHLRDVLMSAAGITVDQPPSFSMTASTQ
jgi:hypothetical protein